MQLTRSQFVKLVFSNKIESLMYYPGIQYGKIRKSNYAKDGMEIFLSRLKKDKEYAYAVCNDSPCFVGYFHAYAYRLKNPRKIVYYVVLKEGAEHASDTPAIEQPHK